MPAYFCQPPSLPFPTLHQKEKKKKNHKKKKKGTHGIGKNTYPASLVCVLISTGICGAADTATADSSSRAAAQGFIAAFVLVFLGSGWVGGDGGRERKKNAGKAGGVGGAGKVIFLNVGRGGR